MLLDEMIAERAALLARLETLDAAINAAEDNGVWQIKTFRSIRNTPFLTTDTQKASEGWVVVYDDPALTRVTKDRYTTGFISGSAAAMLISEGVGDIDKLERVL